LAAVKQEQLAFKYVHHTLLNNGKFVLEAMSVVRDFDFVWRTYVSAKLRRNRGGFYKQCMSAWQKGAANNAN
jgi:2-succinyl-5-enolpyruvyl-6-hydroxy-3-cyclohexene-1-carboxylate synthase